jgi:hypothetical protein
MASPSVKFSLSQNQQQPKPLPTIPQQPPLKQQTNLIVVEEQEDGAVEGALKMVSQDVATHIVARSGKPPISASFANMTPSPTSTKRPVIPGPRSKSDPTNTSSNYYTAGSAELATETPLTLKRLEAVSLFVFVSLDMLPV